MRVLLPLLCLLSPSLPWAAAGPAAQASGPNIVFLFADDQRADTIGAYGNGDIETPAIDGLVARGTSFRSAYCMGSPHGAVCVPSRAMLHTGQPYFRLQGEAFGARPLLGELLRGAGYRTFGTGKWHNGRDSFARSFDSGAGIYFGGMGDHHALKITSLADGAFGPDSVSSQHSSEIFADAAAGFLEDYAGAEPYFLYVAFTAPHDPRDPPAGRRGAQGRRRGLLPRSFQHQFPFDNGFLTVRDEQLAAWPRDPAVVSLQLDDYYALIEHMDSQVARILAAARARPDAGNTIFVYAADHGLALGSHGLLGKQSLFEHSVQAPLIVSGPGIPQGASTDAPVYLFDLFPTLLERAGVAVPDDTFGQSLEPLLADAGARTWKSTFTAMGKTQRALRSGDWKLIRYPAAGRVQLFDLGSDPGEVRDLSADPAQGGRLTWMTLELGRWQARAGDDLSLVPVMPPAPEVDLTGTPRKPDRWQPDWIVERDF